MWSLVSEILGNTSGKRKVSVMEGLSFPKLLSLINAVQVVEGEGREGKRRRGGKEGVK